MANVIDTMRSSQPLRYPEQGFTLIELAVTLASMLLKGEGVQRHATQAALWFEKAANLGNVECQSIIGLLYFNGIGVQHNPAKARTWLTKAAGNGDKQSA